MVKPFVFIKFIRNKWLFIIFNISSKSAEYEPPFFSCQTKCSFTAELRYICVKNLTSFNSKLSAFSRVKGFVYNVVGLFFKDELEFLNLTAIGFASIGIFFPSISLSLVHKEFHHLEFYSFLTTMKEVVLKQVCLILLLVLK